MTATLAKTHWLYDAAMAGLPLTTTFVGGMERLFLGHIVGATVGGMVHGVPSGACVDGAGHLREAAPESSHVALFVVLSTIMNNRAEQLRSCHVFAAACDCRTSFWLSVMLEFSLASFSIASAIVCTQRTGNSSDAAPAEECVFKKKFLPQPL